VRKRAFYFRFERVERCGFIVGGVDVVLGANPQYWVQYSSNFALKKFLNYDVQMCTFWCILTAVNGLVQSDWWRGRWG